MIERAIIELKTNQTQNFGLVGQMTPYPCYITDRFIQAISRLLPLLMVLSWIYTVSMMVKDIVYEKEKRLKEFMRVMGLSNGIHWLAWFITSFIQMFFIVFLLCLILKYGQITPFSDLGVLLLFFTCFSIATIAQCFLISVFFNKANLAAVVAGIIYFLLYLPYTVLINYTEVILPWQKFLASLSSTVAFSYGCQIIASFELQNEGVKYSNLYKSPFTSKDGFNLNVICLILLLDAFIYMLFTWYIENIAPGEYGIPRKWYFPFQPTYWCGESIRLKIRRKKDSDKMSELKKISKINSLLSKIRKKIFGSKEDIIRAEQEKEEALRAKDSSYANFVEQSIEKETTINETPGIEINDLHKIYSRGNNYALKGLSVKFYQSEISAFLGHNGAGKLFIHNCKNKLNHFIYKSFLIFLR
jgi:ATP-binding cassette subfamily A (ABC1) protein 1